MDKIKRATREIEGKKELEICFLNGWDNENDNRNRGITSHILPYKKWS